MFKYQPLEQNACHLKIINRQQTIFEKEDDVRREVACPEDVSIGVVFLWDDPDASCGVFACVAVSNVVWEGGNSWATLIGWFAISRKSHSKSSSTVLKSGVSLIQPLLQCSIDDQITVKRPRPPGMPVATWCSVPAIFWNSLSESLSVLVSFLSVCCIFPTFAGGS